jgi:hypothetical protein
MEVARRLDRAVLVPAVVLAELYRGPGHNSAVDACLSRETGIGIRDTDRSFARMVGGVLAAARAPSNDMVDAHVVAVAAEAGSGVVLTTDEGDLSRLAASYSRVVIQAI